LSRSISHYSVGVGKYPAEQKFDPHAKGLAGFGGIIDIDTPVGERGRLIVVQPEDMPALAHGTPGLVWELDGATAVFVTLDGGRYEVDVADADPFVGGSRAGREVAQAAGAFAARRRGRGVPGQGGGCAEARTRR
jgi:hypothetical protein